MALLGMVWGLAASAAVTNSAAAQQPTASAPATQASAGLASVQNATPARALASPSGPDPWRAFEPTGTETGRDAERSAGRSAGDVDANPPGRTAEIRASENDQQPRPLLRSHASGADAAHARAETGNGASWLRTSLALGGIVALIMLLAWGYRQFAAGGLRWAGRGRQPGLIQVLSRTALSPRHSLCMVRVGPRLVLLGVTPTAVRALDVVQDAELAAQLAGSAACTRPESRTAEFNQLLAHEAREYEPDSVAAETEAQGAAAPRRAGEVRAALAATLQRLRAASGS